MADQKDWGIMTDERARGWYSDPDAAGWVRYWDGEYWTDSRRDPATVAAMSAVGPFTAAVWCLGIAVAVETFVSLAAGSVATFASASALDTDQGSSLAAAVAVAGGFLLAAVFSALVGARRLARQVSSLHRAVVESQTVHGAPATPQGFDTER